jgi:hypothetical protein
MDFETTAPQARQVVATARQLNYSNVDVHALTCRVHNLMPKYPASVASQPDIQGQWPLKKEHYCGVVFSKFEPHCKPSTPILI